MEMRSVADGSKKIAGKAKDLKGKVGNLARTVKAIPGARKKARESRERLRVILEQIEKNREMLKAAQDTNNKLRRDIQRYKDSKNPEDKAYYTETLQHCDETDRQLREARSDLAKEEEEARALLKSL